MNENGTRWVAALPGDAQRSRTCQDEVLSRRVGRSIPRCGKPAKWVTSGGLDLCGTHARSWRQWVPNSPLLPIEPTRGDMAQDDTTTEGPGDPS